MTQLRKLSELPDMHLEAGVLGVLTLLLWIQALFTSPYHEQSIDSLRGDWMVPLAVFAFGLLYCRRIVRDIGLEAAGRLIGTITIAALHAMFLFFLFEQGWVWLREGSFPFGYARFGNRDNLSVLTNTGLSLVITDILARSILKKKASFLPAPLLYTLLILGLLATYTLTTRNGTVGVMLFLIAMTGMLLSRHSISPKTLVVGAVLTVAVALLAIGSYNTVSRWQNLSESGNIALDTEHQRFWLNDKIFPRPQTTSGTPLEESAYMRIVWAKEALKQIIKHPVGAGYNHQALGSAIRLEYDGPIRVGASHNGLLELTLGGGVPALVLWLTFTAILLRRGWVSFFKHSHLTGHRLEMFMPLSALFIGPRSAQTDDRAQ